MAAPARVTIGDAVRETAALLASAGIEPAQREAQILTAHAAGVDLAALIAHPDRPLPEAEDGCIRRMAARRAAREPLPYILGKWEFYGIALRVTAAVMIPRPETETLVETAIEAARKLKQPRILDLGTGSGAIAAALARHVPAAEVVATDISPAAIEVARENVEMLGVGDRVRLLEGDLWGALPCDRQLDTEGSGLVLFDLILSNPPYIRRDEFAGLEPEVRDWEPRIALDGGEDGLSLIRWIVSGAGGRLAPRGWLMVEVGIGQAGCVVGLCESAGLGDSRIIRDPAGRDRVVAARRCV
jgi:release factor glutamine methyltransferase